MTMYAYVIAVSIILLFLIYLYWRFFFFFRDPMRKIPEGNNIVSPADGTIVYIKKCHDSNVPLSIKKKKKIKLEEILKCKVLENKPYYIIGVFMHPTGVHVNRAPIKGIIKKIIYTKGNNLPMTLMWWRVLFRMKPYELSSPHVFTNERNTVFIDGEIPLFVTQIADIYVNKIDCWVQEDSEVTKGQKIGMIKMGSQVDMVFPCSENIEIIVKEGQKVRAGESVLAVIK